MDNPASDWSQRQNLCSDWSQDPIESFGKQILESLETVLLLNYYLTEVQNRFNILRTFKLKWKLTDVFSWS